MPTTVLGNIVERDTGTKGHKSSVKAPSTLTSDVPTGFPKATHRSQSAFAKARANRNESKPDTAPKIHTSNTTITNEVKPKPKPIATLSNDDANDADWRKTMEQENKALIEGMSEEQRKREKEDLISQLGPDIVNIMAKIKAAKENPSDDGKRPSRTYHLSHLGIMHLIMLD